MKKLALLLLVLPLTACGSAIYQRANTTQWEFATDQAACHDYAKAQPQAISMNNNNVLGGTSPKAQMRSCLEAKGYTLASQ